MNRHFDVHFQKEIVTIHPGEFFSTREDVYIATVLGSCVSIALFDQKQHFGGLNHFMLPKAGVNRTVTQDDEGRFGDYAIELLINEMLKMGANHSDLRAKVFGGANVLNTGSGKLNMTGINNANFALQYLATEKIPVLVNDTGGIVPRKIFFHPLTSKVYLKRIQATGADVETIKAREEEYERNLQQAKAAAGDITWF